MLDKLAQHFQSNFYPDMSVEEVRAHLDNPEVLQNAFNHVAENGHNDTHVESIAKGNVKRKAQKGYKEKSFTKGGTWKIVKDLKDYKTHEQGGVDLVIGKKGVEVKNGKTQFYAKDGLVMPNDPQDEIQPTDNFDKRVANTFTPEQKAKIKEHEDWMSNFITSPKYKEMIINQGLDKDAADKLIQERLGNVKSTTYGNAPSKSRFINDNYGRIATTETYGGKDYPYDVHIPDDAFHGEGDYTLGSNPITHEITHRSLGSSNKEENITQYAKQKIGGVMGNAQQMYGVITNNEFNTETDAGKSEKHPSDWTKPTEVLARLNGARKMLHDAGVYNPNTEKLDADKYQEFKNKISKEIKNIESGGYKNIERNRTQYDNLLRKEASLNYLNDSSMPEKYVPKGWKDEISKDSHKKVVWMLNNLVHNDTKGENTNV